MENLSTVENNDHVCDDKELSILPSSRATTAVAKSSNELERGCKYEQLKSSCKPDLK